jgi:single-strand DNA-binding protein
MSTSSTTATPAETQSSTVLLRGRVTAPPEERELPSGDALVTFRLSVPRRPTPLGRGSRQTSDWVDCVAAAARVRRAAGTWSVGDEIEVDGVLRRRFYRTAVGGGGSRLEVEALQARRVRKAAAGATRAAQRSAVEA